MQLARSFVLARAGPLHNSDGMVFCDTELRFVFGRSNLSGVRVSNRIRL